MRVLIKPPKSIWIKLTGTSPCKTLTGKGLREFRVIYSYEEPFSVVSKRSEVKRRQWSVPSEFGAKIAMVFTNLNKLFSNHPAGSRLRVVVCQDKLGVDRGLTTTHANIWHLTLDPPVKTLSVWFLSGPPENWVYPEFLPFNFSLEFFYVLLLF